MGEVISFRPTTDELSQIERVRRSIGAKSRAEAVRFLLRRGAATVGKLSEEPVFRVRAKGRFPGELSSRAIDDLLYRADRTEDA